MTATDERQLADGRLATLVMAPELEGGGAALEPTGRRITWRGVTIARDSE